MIKLPNYDDQMFADIMKKNINKIKTIYPEWTDYNEHDPGITLLELFAWLKEMQQYHLNELTSEGYKSMLKLLHKKVLREVPARMQVAVEVDQNMVLSKQTPFFAGDTQYENQEKIELGTYQLTDIYLKEQSNYLRVNEILMQEGMHITLEKNLDPEAPILYLGIDCDQIQAEKEIRLYWDIEEDYPVKRVRNKGDSCPPRDIIWEYSAQNGEFKQAEVIRDETYALSFSGILSLKLGIDADKLDLDKQVGNENSTSNQRKLIIRARIVRPGCEEQPKIKHIYENVVELIQEHTYTTGIDKEVALKKQEMVIEIEETCTKEVEHIVFIKDRYGYSVHNEYSEEAIDSFVQGRKLTLTDLKVSLAKENTPIYIVSYEKDYRKNMILGSSNGLPYQRFRIAGEGKIILDKLCIMVLEYVEPEIMRWNKWHYVDKLSQAGPFDRCFTYDALTQEIIFGDNENGAVPGIEEDNIMITELVMTKGQSGNIGKQTLDSINALGAHISPVKVLKMFSGQDAESIQDVIGRLKIDLKKTVKAVTVGDYEHILRNMPGIRLLGLKVIPGYNSEEVFTSTSNDPTLVTVVVVPYSEERMPMPDDVFINKVSEYLEDYRILTTRIKVIPPCYVGVQIHAEIECLDAGIRLTKTQVEEKIRSYFDFKELMKMKMDIIGVPIDEEIIIQGIIKIPNVVRVRRMEITCEDRLCYRDKQGKLILLKHAIPYLTDIQLTISEL